MKGVILQEVLLNQVRKDHVQVDVSMLNGESQSGLVKGFDSFTIMLESSGQQKLIYKHAVACISPHGYVQLSQRKSE